jgi:hypothetical protein
MDRPTLAERLRAKEITYEEYLREIRRPVEEAVRRADRAIARVEVPPKRPAKARTRKK